MTEIRKDMLKVKKMVSEVEMIIGKREGETELVNKLIDAENLLTFCMSRLENAIVPPCKVGDMVYLISERSPKNTVDFTVKALHITSGKNSFGHKAPSHALLSNNVLKRLSTRANFEDFGKTVFLTKEEAEQALKERGNDDR